MADKVGVDIEVTGAGSVDKATNSLKGLKAAIKAAADEQARAESEFGAGSEQFQQAARNVAQLRDRMDDLRDSSRQLQGTGIERSATAFSNLGEGLRNLDFDKIKIALQGFKTALAATGITLIIAAVSYLIENFEELSKGAGILGKTLRVVGDIITFIKDKIYELTDAIGITNSELDKMGEAVKTNADKAKEALASQTAEYDRQIAVAKAAGKSTVELEIAKQNAIIETNKKIVEQIRAYVLSGGQLDEEKRKLLTESLNSIKDAVNQEKVITITDQKEKVELYKKHSEDLKKIDEDKVKAYYEYRQKELDALINKLQSEKDAVAKSREEEAALEDAFIDARNKKKLLDAELNALNNPDSPEAQIALLETKRQIELQAMEITGEQRLLINKKYADAEDKIAEDNAKKESDRLAKRQADEKAALQGSLQGGLALNNSLQSLSDAYFDYKRSNLKKGSAEELAAAKKQFEVNKKLQIANATIQGVQAVLAAYSSGSAIPIIGAVAGPAFAILAGIAAAANIAKISNAKFDGGGASDLSTPTATTPNIQAPVISTPQANVQSTQFDNNGNTINNKNKNDTAPLRAYVVETEITSTQDQVSSIKQKSKF